MKQCKAARIMDTETTNGGTLVATSVRIEAAVDAAIAQLAAKDGRRLSKASTMEWLLKTHPRVKKILAAEPEKAAVSA